MLACQIEIPGRKRKSLRLVVSYCHMVLCLNNKPVKLETTKQAKGHSALEVSAQF